jgi:3-dehydroquinate synthase
MADLVLRFRPHAPVSRIHIARGALERLGAFTRRRTGAGRAALVSDERVAALYGPRALASLRKSGIDAELVAFRHGERSKSAMTVERLWEAFSALGIGRGDAVVALGGGVVGDVAGFAAATWLRGVPWIGAPSTLLAQVDSGVGGKTGIDLPAGKNLAGAFHQPAGVLIDPRLLATLPRRELRSGLAEVVKVGMACDAPLFGWVERHVTALAAGEERALEEAVKRGVRVKARVVRADEREREGGARTALNFGHTLGHALERASGYRGLRHGEAVAIGMRAAAALSVRSAGLDPGARARLERVLDALGLPRRVPGIAIDDLIEAMRADKKRARAAFRSRNSTRRGARARDDAARIRWVLTPRVGHASVPRLMSGRLVRAVLLEAGARA